MIYNSTSKVGWSLALTALTFLCASGLGGPLGRFLTHPIFQTTSRITFALYLIHVIVINIWVFSRVQKYRYSHFEFSMEYLGVLFVSYAAATAVTVIIERPVALLVKQLENRLKR